MRATNGIVLLMGCGSLLACSSSSREGTSVARVVASQTVIPPNLANHAGLLCFTDMPDFSANVAAPDSNGWIELHRPLSRAVLGGSGNGPTEVAATDLEFQITGTNPAWNKSIYGRRAEVCAEIGAANACNLEQACWWADGHWSLERKSNPSLSMAPQCPSTGTTLQAPVPMEPGAGLPPLQTGQTYRILVQATHTASDRLWITFFRNGTPLKTVKISQSLQTTGFSGFSVKQLTARVRVQGERPHAAPVPFAGWTIASAVAAEGASEPEGWLACGQYASALAPAQDFQILPSGSCPFAYTLTWNKPDDGVAGHFAAFWDGNVGAAPYSYSGGILWSAGIGGSVPGSTYVHQIERLDGSGAPSPAAAIEFHAGPPCAPIARTLRGAAVLMRFADAPGAPYTRAEAQSWMFGGAGTTSAAEFLRQASLGRVDMTGDAFDWITLPFGIADRAAPGTTCVRLNPIGPNGLPAYAIDPASDDPATPVGQRLVDLGLAYGYGCLGATELWQIAQQQLQPQGVDLTRYDYVFFFVNGYGGAGDNSLLMSASHGPISMGVVVHELGHNFGLGHTGDWLCPPNGLAPSLGDLNGGGCYDARYGSHDPMGVAVQQFNTQSMYRLGWLPADQIQVGVPGQSYDLRKLDSVASGVTRQLRIPLEQNFFYFVEYRTGDGANQFATCNAFSCKPIIENGRSDQSQGVFVWLMRDHGSPADVDNDIIFVRRLAAGETFADSYRGVSVRAVSEGTDTAQVQILACGDGQQDGDETGIDCGGSCGPCGQHPPCVEGADCCHDGIANAGEAGVDCGGPCATPCSCRNGQKDGAETDVDCGGGLCPPCATDQRCTAAADCQGQFCLFFTMSCWDTCGDFAKDGPESDVDCGGPCSPCANGKACNVAADCQSKSCQGHVCGSSCQDGIVNAGETDVDCGGATACPRCASGRACSQASDCAAGPCVGGVCQLACELSGPSTCPAANYNYCGGYSYPLNPSAPHVAGFCSDWSQVGAKPCDLANGGLDCPTSGTFPSNGLLSGGELGFCMNPNGMVSSGAAVPSTPHGLGYCARFGWYGDPTHQVTCAANPCGAVSTCGSSDWQPYTFFQCLEPQ
jgi:hypothetical protein